MTTALKKARAKLMRRPVGLTIAWVILEETGERIGALIPSHPIDRRSLKERKFGIGTQLRAELRKDRNPGFWRKAHVLGGWLADNVEAFAGLGMHDALKKLQEKSEIGVVVENFEMELLDEASGEYESVKASRTVAESLNFSDMDEGRFNELWKGWMEWLRANAWPHLTSAQRDEVEELISEGNQQ